MWLLYAYTVAGLDISTLSFFFLSFHHICDLGNSPTNMEMRLALLLSLNITAETSTQSKFVAYSSGNPCGFFFKSGPIGNLQFELCVSLCSTNTLNYLLTFRHRVSSILGQAFHYSPENAFYIFNQQIYFII